MVTALVRSNHEIFQECEDTFCSIIGWRLLLYQNDLPLIIRDGAGLVRGDWLEVRRESVGGSI